MTALDREIDRKTQFQLIILRAIAILLQILVLLIVQFYLKIQLPIVVLSFVIAIYLGIHGFIYYQYHYQQIELTQPSLFLHFLSDVIILCIVLYFAGGATNPFISLLLFPLTLTATILGAGYTWIMALVVIIAYSLLMRWHIPLPSNHAHGHEFSLHILGMWFGFILSASLVGFFIVNIRGQLKQKEQQLHQAREQSIRDKQLLTLATLAASTAHEMGTPLATLDLICDELNAELQDPQLKKELLQPMKQQLRHCKKILANLSSTSGNVHLQGGQRQNLLVFFEQLIDEWQQRHLNTHINTQYPNKSPVPDILAERLLFQALHNLLDNAQKVSREKIECLLDWDQQFIYFYINDSGPGLSPQQLHQLGKYPMFHEQKDVHHMQKDGMGLGSFLSTTIIEHMRGSIHFYNRNSGGLSVMIKLPINFHNEVKQP